MEYSMDGDYLASGSEDGSIRIWHAESSLHATTSQTRRERPARAPEQADTILVGSRSSSTALSFSRTDSNLLASGGSNGEITVWNIKEKACIHSFNPRCGPISSLFFAGGADIACIAAAHRGSVIRLWKAEGSSDFSSEIIGNADVSLYFLRPAFSPSGSFLASSFGSMPGNKNEATLALYELETMTKTQSVVMPDFTANCVAVSPDSRQLVVGDLNGRIQLLQTEDFSIHRDMDTTGEAKAVCAVAFDPTCRVVAFGYHDGRLELRSI
jgi:WD40 repeat protein